MQRRSLFPVCGLLPSFFVLIVVYRKGFANCGVAYIKLWHLEDADGVILADANETQYTVRDV